jgi:hypothetical protein
MVNAMKDRSQESLLSQPLLSQSALFINLTNSEQALLSGGSFVALAMPTNISTYPLGYSSEGFIATDGKGNGVKLQDLLDYLHRTVG